MPTLVDHGTPVSAARQFTSALTPNAAGTGWNYIACSNSGAAGVPVEWPVVKNLTTSPTTTVYSTVTHAYANLTYQYTNQLRAANGRIFFPCNDLYTCYYDPTDEQVHQLGPIVESPAVNPNASTILYSASFDVDGLLYMGTQESANRAACVIVTDTTTLVQTIIGYVGDSATGFTTYAYRLAPDTHTSTKWIYVVYGEAPWQLWAIHITTGVATKLYEVSSTGNISFLDIAGQGWIAQIHTDLGQIDDVYTQWWCLDGAIYAYTFGVSPPVTARNVTPASNPLTGSPPNLDTDRGIGSVGWRNGGSGAYTYVPYTVAYTYPVAIESLVASTPNNGIIGNAAGYTGFFQLAGATLTWYGAWSNTAVSEGPRLNVGGTIYIAGYPNGVAFKYDPTATWDPINNSPSLLGYFGLNGISFAGIKYATYLAWTALAGVSGRLYCAGFRERNGTGSGIGSWDKTTGSFAGTFAASGMDAVFPTGLVVLEGTSYVVMATEIISGTGSAPLYVFDYDLNYITQYTPLVNVPSLGSIFKAATSNVITGIVQGSGNSIGLYQYNVQTHTLIAYTEIGIFGLLGAICQQPNSTVWVVSGTSMVKVDIDALTATVIADLSAIAPVATMAFASDTHSLFMAAGSPSGVSGAQLYSMNTGGTPPVSAFTFDASFDFTFDTSGNTATFDSTFDFTFDTGHGLAYVAISSTGIIGNGIQMQAIAHYTDGSTADVTTSASWSSSNPSVATVGLHTGIVSYLSTAGSAIITVAL